jgi:hypothetical protein
MRGVPQIGNPRDFSAQMALAMHVAALLPSSLFGKGSTKMWIADVFCTSQKVAYRCPFEKSSEHQKTDVNATIFIGL